MREPVPGDYVRVQRMPRGEIVNVVGRIAAMGQDQVRGQWVRVTTPAGDDMEIAERDALRLVIDFTKDPEQ